MKQNEPIQQRLINAYFELKEELGHRPSYLEYHLKTNEDSKAIQQKFKTYPILLEHAGELSELETEGLKQHQDWDDQKLQDGRTKIYAHKGCRQLAQAGYCGGSRFFLSCLSNGETVSQRC